MRNPAARTARYVSAAFFLGLLTGAGLLLSHQSGPLGPEFSVTLPAKKLPYPTPLPAGQGEPKFVLRGTKGWAWTWEQYLDEIPVLARYRMNFLMSCYTSVFTDPEKLVNRWWEPLPEKTLAGIEKVARACRDKDIVFCFSFHPALFSDRPLRYDNDADFEAMGRNFASVQGLGVRWFSLSYDDIDVKGKDIAALGADYAFNPRAYDPARSIGQAIVHLAETPAQRAVLKDLVELYPGNLISGSTMTSYNCVLEKLDALLGMPDGADLARRLVGRVEDVAARLDREFPNRLSETKKTPADHIARARKALEAKDAPGAR